MLRNITPNTQTKQMNQIRAEYKQTNRNMISFYTLPLSTNFFFLHTSPQSPFQHISGSEIEFFLHTHFGSVVSSLLSNE